MNFFRSILIKKPLHSPAIFSAEGEPQSRKQLAVLATALFNNLRRFGFTAGERIAVLGTGGSAMLATIIAVAENFICAPINSLFSDSEIKRIITDLKISAIIIPPGEKERPHLTGAPSLKIFGQSSNWQIKITGKILKINARQPKKRSGALIIVTSGTTDKSKYVLLTHDNLTANAKNMRAALRLKNNDRCLDAMPLFHVHGLMTALASLAAGGSVICLPKFQPAVFFERWAKNKPTWYTASPTIHQAILREAKNSLSLIKDTPLRLIRSSSASLPTKILTELETIFRAPVLESYGMTEATLQITSNLLPPLKRKPGSVGRALGVKLIIADKNGRVLKRGQSGEVLIKGDSIIKNYENQTKKTASSFYRGWLKTGDIGRLDKDNYLYLVGRLKEMINKGGENINPKEIENAALTHPAIQQAAAFSLPHKTLGEDIGLALVLKENRKLSELTARRHILKRLSEFKVPSLIFFLKEFPATPTGKIQKFKLTEQVIRRINSAPARPASLTDRFIINTWQEILKIKKVSPVDNFFHIGGDSLLMEEFLKKLKNRGVNIKKRQFLEKPTLGRLLGPRQ